MLGSDSRPGLASCEWPAASVRLAAGRIFYGKIAATGPKPILARFRRKANSENKVWRS